MKTIELTQGKVARVSDHRFEYLSQWSWYAYKNQSGTWYAARKDGKWPFRKHMTMHRQIMGVTDSNIQVDHRDSDGLNNVDENLRVATHAQNASNRGKQSDNTSGYKGVTWAKRDKRYIAKIQVSGKSINLGSFVDPIDAAHTYDEAAKKYHGEFARLNFNE